MYSTLNLPTPVPLVNFDTQRLSSLPASTKSTHDLTFASMEPVYDYDGKFAPLKLDLPVLTSPTGLWQGSDRKWSLMLPIDQADILEQLGKVHSACAGLIAQQRAEMLLPLFTAENLKPLFSEKDGKINMFIKVLPSTARFYDPNGRMMRYSELQNKRLKVSCTVLLRSLFSNGQIASIQLQLQKGVIVSLEDRLSEFTAIDPAKLIRCA